MPPPIEEEEGDEDAADDDIKKISGCIIILSDYITQMEVFNLESIYMNNCKLNDRDAVKIFDTVMSVGNQKIKRIYFNQNDLSNVTAKKVAEMLNAGNTKVKEVGLKWNKITAIGGNAIATSLC
jgi:hypothetical protein